MKRRDEVKVTYDKEADAAYIYLDDISQDEVSETFTCDDLPPTVKGDINLDFDSKGILRGIEILGASKVLPQNALKG